MRYVIDFDGAPIRIRTADPLITNQMLYQLSYRGNTGQIADTKAACKGWNAI